MVAIAFYLVEALFDAFLGRTVSTYGATVASDKDMAAIFGFR